MTTTRQRYQTVCAACGSSDVLADAYAAWNTRSQAWELSSTHDKGSYCAECDGESRVEPVILSIWQAEQRRIRRKETRLQHRVAKQEDKT